MYVHMHHTTDAYVSMGLITLCRAIYMHHMMSPFSFPIKNKTQESNQPRLNDSKKALKMRPVYSFAPSHLKFLGNAFKPFCCVQFLLVTFFFFCHKFHFGFGVNLFGSKTKCRFIRYVYTSMNVIV